MTHRQEDVERVKRAICKVIPVFRDYVDADKAVKAALDAMPPPWESVSDQKGNYLLYFPAITNKRGKVTHSASIRVDSLPFLSPRQPTHCHPIPAPPEGTE